MFPRNILLVAGMLGILVGGALIAVAEGDERLRKVSIRVTVLGLVCLGLAFVVEGWGWPPQSEVVVDRHAQDP